MTEQNKQQGSDINLPLPNKDNSSTMPSTNFLEQALQELSDEEKKDLRQKAAEEALRLQTKSAEISLDDNAARRETYDHINAYNSLDKNNVLHGHKIISEYKTGAGTRRIESKSGITCFVVTATYGDINHPTVIFYRQFRDNFLIQHTSGRQFVAWYYKKGPKLSIFLKNRPILKLLIRSLLKVLQYPLLILLKIYKK